MAVNKISLNKVDSQNVSQIVIQPDYPVDSIADQFDIFYHLGTNLQQTAWSNPTPSNVSISLIEGSSTSGPASAITGRDTASSASGYNFAASPLPTLQIEFLNNYEVDLHSYVIYNSTWFGPSLKSWIIEGSQDSITWYKLDQVTNHPLTNGGSELYYCETRFGFFKYFRIRVLDNSANTFTAVNFFGKLRNLTTGQAAIEFTKDIFASYPSVSNNARDKNQILRYDGSYWEPRTRFPYEVRKLNLSADYTIASAYKPTFYIVSPNGANRTITLPSTPNKDDVIKIKNVDGLFDLTVEESPGDSSPVVMSNSGKLQYEFVYDGIEWQVTG